MVKGSMHFVYYLFLLTFCIGEGDGRWKKTIKDNLQRDIKLYKKITERVEHDLQEYYAEYEDHGLLHLNFNRNYYEINQNIPKAKLLNDNVPDKKREPLLTRLIKLTNNIPIHNQGISNDSTLSNEIVESITHVKATNPKIKWPKFEDILLEIGKKYDWKNDRWIKVKEKFKIKDTNMDNLDNSISIHEKHRFLYRTIKLNRGKNKRNVVIAVTAIR